MRSYRREWLRADLLAGVVLAAILVPQGMAYAQLAGLPAVTGLIGMGAAKVAAGLFQGFAVFTSGSRTAVAEQSAAKSQVTGLVGAGLVTVLLLFLSSLLAHLPQAALAALVIVAALSLMDLQNPAPLPAGAQERLRRVARRDSQCDPARCAPGDRRRGGAAVSRALR